MVLGMKQGQPLNPLVPEPGRTNSAVKSQHRSSATEAGTQHTGVHVFSPALAINAQALEFLFIFMQEALWRSHLNTFHIPKGGKLIQDVSLASITETPSTGYYTNQVPPQSLSSHTHEPVHLHTSKPQ